jgi:hypothetical protein
MKKTNKSDAVKSAQPATPATPAPSPVKKSKATEAAKTAVAKTSQSAAANPARGRFAASETAPVPLSTTIVAQVDVGFGNTLYVRGDGPGLSWEKGLALDCVADDKWSLALEESAKPIVYKFLLNDQTWCKGEDHVAQPGTTVTVSPVF